MTFFEIEGINKHFGGLRALREVSFQIDQGEVLGIIGPNGAGKTTLFNVITGALKPTRGRIIFNDKEITGLPMDVIAKKGLVRTFQATTVWNKRTISENMNLAFYLHRTDGLLQWFLNTREARRQNVETRKRAKELLRQMGLWDIKDEVAENLPHGKLRILGVCIALALTPKMLLLDEPVAGMNPVEKAEMVTLIKKLKDFGTTIAIIEHDMATIMSLAERIVVLNMGVKIAEGKPEKIKENKVVIEAYLGSDED